MHEYGFDLVTVRLSVILGVLITTIFYERMHLTTGGAIVPGYLALFIPKPLFIAVTALTAYMTWFFVSKVLAKKYILYGRRKFEIEILTGLSIHLLFVGIAYYLTPVEGGFWALYGVGLLIPAIIAHDMYRQGPPKTIAAVLANTAIVGALVFLIDSLTGTIGWYEQMPVAWIGIGEFGYPPDLLLAGVFVSVLTGMVVFRKLNLRSGGFVTGAYLGLMVLRPLDLLFSVVCALLAYVLVTRFMMDRMLAFGRRKLAIMVMSAAVIAWTGEIFVALATSGEFIPWRGFHVITLMIPALLANDSERQGPARTLLGAALSTASVFCLVNLLQFGRAYFHL